MEVPIAYLGEIQKKDIENSSGNIFYNNIERVCTVIKPNNSFNERGDNSPKRMAELFGGDWKDYNEHYIIQVAGCPLKCWYCYVDNLSQDILFDEKTIANRFYNFIEHAKDKNIDINVLHLMGGAPGKYPLFWKKLRESMDKRGLKDKILFSDVIFVENYFYGVKPWEYSSLENFILTGCLKGTNRKNFFDNTKKDLFEQSLKELENYTKFHNFYLSLINYDEEDLNEIYSIIPKERIDFLKIINYEVTKYKNDTKENNPQ